MNLLTRKQLCEKLGCSRQTTYRLSYTKENIKHATASLVAMSKKLQF